MITLETKTLTTDTGLKISINETGLLISDIDSNNFLRLSAEETKQLTEFLINNAK